MISADMHLQQLMHTNFRNGSYLYRREHILILWLSNFLALSVPDEDFSRNASCALILKSLFL